VRFAHHLLTDQRPVRMVCGTSGPALLAQKHGPRERSECGLGSRAERVFRWRKRLEPRSARLQWITRISGSFGPLVRAIPLQPSQTSYRLTNGVGARCCSLRRATTLCEGWTSKAS